MRVWTLDEPQSHCSRFTSDMFNQTIPKQKRPFLGLKVHSFTQNMLICWCQNYSNMWIVQQFFFQPLTSLVSLLKRLWKVCLCHGMVTTKTWQKCIRMVSCFESMNGLSSQGMVFFVQEWSPSYKICLLIILLKFISVCGL
jgi:hypothetical protein